MVHKFVNNMKSISLVFMFILASMKGFTQQKTASTTIHTFLQKNADSTIIFKYESNWIQPPEYFILSKKVDTITAYFYKSFYKTKINMPDKIRDSLYKINKYYESNNVSVNRFFIPKYLTDEDLLVFWRALLKQHPWQINDDSIDGKNCTNTKKGFYKNISDGGGISLYLITKNNIKHLYFYAPKYYEKELCPGRKGRQAILEIEALFKTYFKNEW